MKPPQEHDIILEDELTGPGDFGFEVGDGGKALRLNNNKIDPTNIHPAMLWPLYQVGHYGSKKYKKFNYLKGGKPASEYLASARRHFDLLASGEKIDVESGCLHAAHVAWNLLFLAMAEEFGLLGEEDYPPAIDMGKLRELMKEEVEHRNVAKLCERYPNGFSTEASLNRKEDSSGNDT